MTNAKFDALFGGPPRKPEDRLTQREMDLAASIQAVTEEVVLKLAKGIASEFNEKNLCLAGGVALNCVANGKLARSGLFDKLWLQPAAGDAGGALGAALVGHYLHQKNERKIAPGLDAMRGGYLGPDFALAEIQDRLTRAGAVFETLDDEGLVGACAEALAEGKALGWFQGRMEFGPRALGARSILGDARSPSMQKQLNLKVKYRESFRPFAPAVLAEDAEKFFDMKGESPYMLLVADVKDEHRIAMTEEEKALFGIDKLNIPRSSIPAVTHVDYSARIQTVHKETNSRFHELISRFKERTGSPVVVNTSFNVRGEPIVGSPEDAFRCFMGTEIEVLAVGNCFLRKEKQDPSLKKNYESAFELD
jgi:carbamoyltransferase